MTGRTSMERHLETLWGFFVGFYGENGFEFLIIEFINSSTTQWS